MSRHHRKLLRRLRAEISDRRGPTRPRVRRNGRARVRLWSITWGDLIVSDRTRLGAIRLALRLVRGGLA